MAWTSLPAPGSDGGHAREPLLLLLLGAVLLEQVHGHEVGVEDARERHPAPAELDPGQRVGHQVEPGAAVLLGNGEPEQAELLHPLDDLLGELVPVLELVGDRDDLLLDEVPNGLDDGALLVVERNETGLGCELRHQASSF